MSLIVVVLFGFSPGCGTLAGDRGWGQDATLAPGWDRVGRAAWNAAIAPETWVPAAGALALGINHADQDVQEWAATKTPVFRSQANANKMSDVLWSASSAVWLASGVAAPSGADSDVWIANKAKGLGLETGAGIALRSFVGHRKNTMNRTSPNGADQDGYLSVHAAGSAFYATLASRHVDAFDWPDGAVMASRAGLGALTAATAWARVEADQHYPADVLKSIALGHFFGAFVTDAFLGQDNPRQAMVLFEPSKAGMLAMVLFAF
jgi:hypothetical protein